MLAALLVCATVTAAPATAAPATAAPATAAPATAAVRLGPDLTPVQNGAAYGCAPGHATCTWVNLHGTNPQALTASPVDGVITKWRFRAGCTELGASLLFSATARSASIPGPEKGGGPNFESHA
jgi:hypothetical protein